MSPFFTSLGPSSSAVTQHLIFGFFITLVMRQKRQWCDPGWAGAANILLLGISYHHTSCQGQQYVSHPIRFLFCWRIQPTSSCFDIYKMASTKYPNIFSFSSKRVLEYTHTWDGSVLEILPHLRTMHTKFHACSECTLIYLKLILAMCLLFQTVANIIWQL